VAWTETDCGALPFNRLFTTNVIVVMPVSGLTGRQLVV